MLALGVLVFTRKRVTWGDGWMWPVPPIVVGGVRFNPVISSGFGWRGSQQHPGADIVFSRRTPQDLIAQYPSGTPNGGRGWFAPPGVPIVAARAGKVWSVAKTSKGWAVVLDHSKPFTTFYTHMEGVALPLHASGKNVNTGTATHVEAGQVIGFMGWSPEDAERVRHLHFEVWHGGAADSAVDAATAMREWAHAQPFKVG